MGGAQGFGVALNGGRALIVEVDPRRAERRLREGWIGVVAASYDEALAAHLDPDGPDAVGLVGNASEVVPRLLADGVEFDVVTDQTPAHDPLGAYVPAGYAPAAAADADPDDPALPERRSSALFARTLRRCSATGTAGRSSSSTGTACARKRLHGGVRRRPLGSPVSSRRTSARSLPVASGRSAGSRSRRSRGPAPERGRCHGGRRQRLAARLDRARPRARVPLQGLPARICWLGLGERDAVALRLNELVRSGDVGPLALGRDHMDPASVASPTRETEGMRDGSDAIADWPILSALLSAVQGASWVAVGNGGGVGVGKVDPLRPGRRRRRERDRGTEAGRVFRSDPALGVARYADAGYPEALAEAERTGSTALSLTPRVDILIGRDELARTCSPREVAAEGLASEAEARPHTLDLGRARRPSSTSGSSSSPEYDLPRREQRDPRVRAASSPR